MDIASSSHEYPKWEEIEWPEEVSEESADQSVDDGQEEGSLSSFCGDRGDQPSEERLICALGHGALKSNLELAKLTGDFSSTESSFPAKVVVKQGKKVLEDTVLRAGVLPVTLFITGLLLMSAL